MFTYAERPDEDAEDICIARLLDDGVPAHEELVCPCGF